MRDKSTEPPKFLRDDIEVVVDHAWGHTKVIVYLSGSRSEREEHAKAVVNTLAERED